MWSSELSEAELNPEEHLGGVKGLDQGVESWKAEWRQLWVFHHLIYIKLFIFQLKCLHCTPPEHVRLVFQTVGVHPGPAVCLKHRSVLNRDPWTQ